jgi:hypothetical protein
MKPSWLDADSFAGIVVDRGNLEIRSFRSVEREGCSMSALVRIPLTESFLKRLSTEVGLQISGSQPMLTQQYRAHRGLAGDIEANFSPGSGRPVEVLVSCPG